MALTDAVDEGLGADTGFLGGQHDRGAMRVVGTNEMHGVAGHAPGAHPDIGLDITHQMAQVQGPIGIGQGAGDEDLAWG